MNIILYRLHVWMETFDFKRVCETVIHSTSVGKSNFKILPENLAGKPTSVTQLDVCMKMKSLF